MSRLAHPVAGSIALLTIATFWCATIASELFGSWATIAAVKAAILWGMAILVPALAVTGGSGIIRAGGRRYGPIGRKLIRMRLIAANGLIILLPAALFLAARAGSGQVDAAFYAVQAIELLAGGVNIVLLVLSMRDGLRMTGRLQPATRRSRDRADRPAVTRFAS